MEILCIRLLLDLNEDLLDFHRKPKPIALRLGKKSNHESFLDC